MRGGAAGGEDRAMLHPDHPIDTAAQALRHLEHLRAQLAIVGPSRLLEDAGYVSDLREDIAASETVFVGLAVTEIASLRGELSGRLQG